MTDTNKELLRQILKELKEISRKLDIKITQPYRIERQEEYPPWVPQDTKPWHETIVVD